MTGPRKARRVLTSVLAVLTVVDNDLAELSTKARKVDGAGVPPLKASVWREEIQLKDFMDLLHEKMKKDLAELIWSMWEIEAAEKLGKLKLKYLQYF